MSAGLWWVKQTKETYEQLWNHSYSGATRWHLIKSPFLSSKYFASQFAHFGPSNVFCKSYGFETEGDSRSVSDLTCIDGILGSQHVWNDTWCHFHQFTPHGHVLHSDFSVRLFASWHFNPYVVAVWYSFSRTTFRTTYRESYYYYCVSCHRPVLPGNSLEPTVIPTAQASSFTLQYFPHYVWCSKYSCLL
jgi:hypothetical protein